MAGVDGVDLSFDALAFAAGALHAVDVVLVEHRQRRRGVGDDIVGSVQRLDPREVSRRRHRGRVAEAGDLRHLPQTHIGPHGDDAGENMARIGFLLHVAAQNMGENAKKSGRFGPKPQEIGDADTRAVEQTVDRLLFTGIDQRPGCHKTLFPRLLHI